MVDALLTAQSRILIDASSIGGGILEFRPNVKESVNQGVAEGLDKPVHRIGLTVTDPNHPMVSKRGETIQKTVRVPGHDPAKAITAAIAHHRRKGYKVHDHHYLGTVDEGQRWPDDSKSLAQRDVVVPNIKDYYVGDVPWHSDNGQPAARIATKVNPSITPTTVKRKEIDRPVPAFLQKESGQEPGADYRDPPETDYDATGHDASVARLKHLAGVGPMKTVYDPNKRVYRNMPTAVQPKKS
jgi:hypothetical protein